MIKAIIIEDEAYAAERLKMLVKEVDRSIDIIAELSSVKDAVSWFMKNEADLIFLDINLSDGSAFNIFDQVAVKSPIIFTTAYHEYALKAFDQMSIDYLLKPISAEKLSKSIAKYKDLTSQQKTISTQELSVLATLVNDSTKAKKFIVNIGNKVRVISESEIAYFSYDSKITFIHTHENGRHTVDYSLKQLEDMLSPTAYYRVNRQYLISRSSFDALHYYSATRVRILLKPSTSEEIFLAREKIGDFKRWIVE